MKYLAIVSILAVSVMALAQNSEVKRTVASTTAFITGYLSEGSYEVHQTTVDGKDCLVSFIRGENSVDTHIACPQ